MTIVEVVKRGSRWVKEVEWFNEKRGEGGCGVFDEREPAGGR